MAKRIITVDDAATMRRLVGYTLRGVGHDVIEAEDGVQALSVFRQHANEIGIIVTDQRMPNETGVGFLSKIADDYPDIIKILSTAYSDIDAAIGSVNQGGIFRYMTKPWDIPQLEVTLRRAMEFFSIRRERDALLDFTSELQGRLGAALQASAGQTLDQPRPSSSSRTSRCCQATLPSAPDPRSLPPRGHSSIASA